MSGPEPTFEELGRELAGASWVLIAGGSPGSAAKFAAGQATPPISTIGKDELVAGGLKVIRSRPLDAAVLLTSSWARQRNPQLYAAALAATRAKRHFLVDQADQHVRRISATDRPAILAGVPFSLASAAGRVAIEAAGFEFRRLRPASMPRVATGQPLSILAVWMGSDDSTVGGSISHISGILHGLRSIGARIGLLTMLKPPPQLAGAVDDLELIPMLPASALATGDIERVAVNRRARRAGMRLAARIRPTFVYQRHQAFLTAGSDLAGHLGIPLVLEWNASEVWVRRNWENPLPIERLLDPLLAATERDVLRRSSLVVAVSDPAAHMAIELGVGLDRIITLPNGVDVKDIDRAVGYSGQVTPTPRRLGWIGTFGPWHGAEIAITALSELPSDVELLMIGEGERLSSCKLLAESLGVAGRIEWTGLLPHDEAIRCLASCSILLSPHVSLGSQEFFGSPTKLFEYMALQRAIVASRLAQIGEVLEDGRNSVLVEPGDPKALAAAIEGLLREPERGRRLALAARRDAINEHDWKKRAKQLIEALAAAPREPA